MKREPHTKLLLLVLGLAAALPARADEWTARDTALQATGIVLLLADVGQTRWALDSGHFRETNPILGSHPSRLRLGATTAVELLAHYAIARALPRPYRTIFQCAVIGVEVNAVGRNFMTIGARWSLP
jgi:hypothetical protein